MNETIGNDRKLAEDLGRLPRSRTPGSDLWPGIQARLGEQEAQPEPARTAWRTPALAASVAVAFIAGMLLGRQSNVVDPFSQPQQSPLAGQVMMGTLQASEREYQAAFQTLAPVGMAPTLFELRDIEAIERSWSELRQAESALLAALQEHPDNPYLGEKLLDLRAQQLDFMRHLRMLDQNSRRNT